MRLPARLGNPRHQLQVPEDVTIQEDCASALAAIQAARVQQKEEDKVQEDSTGANTQSITYHALFSAASWDFGL